MTVSFNWIRVRRCAGAFGTMCVAFRVFDVSFLNSSVFVRVVGLGEFVLLIVCFYRMDLPLVSGQPFGAVIFCSPSIYAIVRLLCEGLGISRDLRVTVQ